MAEGKPYFGGVPYQVDAKKLDESYPVPSLVEGRVISREEVSGVLGIECGSQRYYGVVNHWRNRLRNECGIHADYDVGEGIRILNPAELFTRTENRIRSKGKQFVRKVNDLRWVESARLEPAARQRFDHQVIHAAKIKDAVLGGLKGMAIDLAPIKCLPKPIRKVS